MSIHVCMLTFVFEGIQATSLGFLPTIHPINLPLWGYLCLIAEIHDVLLFVGH